MRDTKGRFIDGTHGVSTRFTTERSRGNQHAKGNPKNRTTFGVLDIHMEKHPGWKGGIQTTKRNGFYVNLGDNKRVSQGRYNWSKVYGEIPKGYIIYHKDGNVINNEIDNLECISRAELIRLNKV